MPTHHCLYESNDYKTDLELQCRNHPLCRIKIRNPRLHKYLHKDFPIPQKPSVEEMERFLAAYPRQKEKTPKGQRTPPNPTPSLDMPDLLQIVYDQLEFLEANAHRFEKHTETVQPAYLSLGLQEST